MKKALIVICLLVISVAIFPQEVLKEISLVINIEVPVRVFKGKTFVDSLTIDDFQVYEDGVRQKIEAVYLVKKKEVQRKEEKKKFDPQTSRSFFLFFEINEFLPRVNDAIDYFVDNVLLPQDKLFVMTPMKSYRMKERVFELRTKEDIRKEWKSMMRKDVIVGSSEYNSIIRDLKEVARSLAAILSPDAEPKTDDVSSSIYGSTQLDELCMAYATSISRLENLRDVDQLQLLDFANFLKSREGQKYVFLFYQREFIPLIDSRILEQALTEFQDNFTLQHSIANLQSLFMRDISFDVDLIKKTYADASVSIHFLFISKPSEHIYGISMEERSNDIYGAFREMAQATGGFVDSSANPEYLFKQAVNAAESYYLLYYSPKNYVVDGKFKRIEVKLEGKRYRIAHREGYFAD